MRMIRDAVHLFRECGSVVVLDLSILDCSENSLGGQVLLNMIPLGQQVTHSNVHVKTEAILSVEQMGPRGPQCSVRLLLSEANLTLGTSWNGCSFQFSFQKV